MDCTVTEYEDKALQNLQEKLRAALQRAEGEHRFVLKTHLLSIGYAFGPARFADHAARQATVTGRHAILPPFSRSRRCAVSCRFCASDIPFPPKRPAAMLTGGAITPSPLHLYVLALEQYAVDLHRTANQLHGQVILLKALLAERDDAKEGIA